MADGIIEKLSRIAEINREDLPKLRANAADPRSDETGSASNTLALAMRSLGVASYLVEHDIMSFKSCLEESASVRRRLFQRFDSGEPVSESYVSMISYKALFDALAAGRPQLAESLASHMGGRAEIEKYHDHPFDLSLGYTLRAFALQERQEMGSRAAEFSDICQKRGNRDFLGYAQLFDAIAGGSAKGAEDALVVLVEGHKRQAKGRGVFANSVDRALSVWGVGMVNLARGHGLSVNGAPPLIPDDLLVTVMTERR